MYNCFMFVGKKQVCGTERCNCEQGLAIVFTQDSIRSSKSNEGHAYFVMQNDSSNVSTHTRKLFTRSGDLPVLTSRDL